MGGAFEPARGRVAAGLNPRAAAHRILGEVRGGTLSDRAASRILPAVDPADRGLALDIAFGCLRLRARLDAWIRACADRPPSRMDRAVCDWLRIGAYQLTELRTPDHAAVGETVGAARSALGRRRAGYVNAVLRALALLGFAEPLADNVRADIFLLFESVDIGALDFGAAPAGADFHA